MKNKKIVLIRPKNIIDESYKEYFPLGLLHLGTLLEEKGYLVRIIDAAMDGFGDEKLRECKDALLVGISVLTPEVKGGLEISKQIKDACDTPIVWGGWHPTLFPKQTCEEGLVDYVIYGEGEETLLKLIKALGKKGSVEKINGLVYKKNEKVYVNPKADFVNLDKLPVVNYNLVDVEKYIWKILLDKKMRVLQYQSSRGCPYRCTFCINAVTGNQFYRKKSAGKVLDELEILIKKHKIDFVSFIDDNFFVDIGRARKICEGILARKFNIKWFAECRANYFKKEMVDEKFLKLAKKSGLIMLTIGAESGSEKSLKIMKKDITVKEIITSAEMMNKYGIVPIFSFIVGIPNEKKEDMFKTVKLIIKLRKICPEMVGGIGTFRPYPDCELSRELVAKGELEEPKTLRGWCDKKNIAIYSESINKQKWQKYSGLANKIAYYGRFLLSMSESQIQNKIKKGNLKYLLVLLFMKITKARMKYLFFDFMVDKYLYEKIKSIGGKR